MRKAVKALKVIICLLVFIIISAIALLILATDKHPIVVAKSHNQVESADTIPALLDQLRYSLRRSRVKQTIRLTSEQLNSLAGFIQRAKPQMKIQANLNQQRSVLAMTYQLPSNPFGDYLNISVWVAEADKLDVENIDIGSLSLPGKITLDCLTTIMDWYIGSDIASQLPQRITQVRMDPGRIIFKIAPVHDLLTAMKSIKRELNEEEQHFQDSIVHYLQFLASVKIIDLQLPYVSMSQYLNALFNEAQKRSEFHDASVENRAALLALAIFDGSRHFARFAGNIDAQLLAKAKPHHQLLLSRRRDLCQHFIYSAAIEILSQQGLSIAVGEFKELMDRSSDGSGFSFADLAADMTGITLAQQATDPDYAQKLQQRLSAPELVEADFFPNIEQLPEGMNKQQFEQKIGEVDSPLYKEYRQRIEQQIANLPVFR